MGEMIIAVMDIVAGTFDERAIIIGKVRVIIGQANGQTIEIYVKRTKQEIAMRTEQEGTMIGIRLTMGEFRQAPHQKFTG